MQVICLHCKKDRGVLGSFGGCFCAAATAFWNNTKTINYGKPTVEEQVKKEWDKAVEGALTYFKHSE